MIEKVSVKEWMALEGLLDEEELKEFYGNVTQFYVMDESAIAGARHEDGTYSIFGCGMDASNLTYDQMVQFIESGM